MVEVSQLVSLREAAQILNVHPSTLARWTEQGLAYAYRIGPRGDRRYEKKDVMRLAKLTKRDRVSAYLRAPAEHKPSLY